MSSLPRDLKIETRGSMAEIEQEFVDGKIQAMFVSRLPKPFRDGNQELGPSIRRSASRRGALPARRRLLPDHACARLQKRIGASSIQSCRARFSKSSSKPVSARTQRWVDPNWSMVMWGRRELERQNQLCSFDPWKNGLEANRKNIERFALYSHEQGLTKRRLDAGRTVCGD